MTDTKMCPYCGEDIKIEAIKCKHCHSMLSKEDDDLVSAISTKKPTDTKFQKPNKINWWGWIAAFIVIMFILIIASTNGNDTTTNRDSNDTPSNSLALVNNTEEVQHPIDIEKAASMVEEAKILIDTGKFEEAQSILNEAFLYDPDNKEIDVLIDKANILIDEKFEKEFRADSKTYEFRVLDRDAEKLAGEKIKLHGEVIQIMIGSGVTVIRLAVTETRYGWSASDVVYVTYLGDTNIYKDDIVTIYGSIIGFHTYESVAGYNITLPHVLALYYDN